MEENNTHAQLRKEYKNVDQLVTDYTSGRLNRRAFIRGAVALVGVTATEGLLVSCQQGVLTAPPAAGPTPAPQAQVQQPPVWVRPEGMQSVLWLDCTRFRKDPPWKIGNLSQGPTNSWALMFDGHIEYAVKEKYKNYFSDYFYADGQGNAAKQVSDIESLIVQKPDVIVGVPLGAALKAGMDKAWDAGIPLVQGQLPYETDKYASYINADNYLNGARTAEWLANKLGGKGQIVMTSGIAGTDTAEQRLKGARDVFAKYPDIKVLAHGYMDWSISKAKQGFEAWIAAYPKFDGIWSDSAFMAWGAIEALVEAKRDIPPLTGEPLNGFMKLCKQYNVPFFARGYPNAFGLDMVDMAVRVLMGEVVPRYVFEPSLEFELDKVDQYLRPDASDDLWLDYRYPKPWSDKQFKK